MSAKNGLPECKPVLEIVQGPSGWSVTTEGSLIEMHDYAIAIDTISTAGVLSVHGQVVSTCCTINVVPCRRCVPMACLKGKWYYSDLNLPKESKEESDTYVRINVLYCSCARADKHTPEAD